MHALSVSLLRAKQLPVITNGLGASPHAGSTCTIGVVTVRPLNRLPARLYFKLKPDPNNTFFFIFTCTTQYPWVLANLNLSRAMAPSKKKRTHTVFRDSSAHRSASTSKPRFVGVKVRLGDVVSASSERNKGGRCSAVYSVTNSQGFVPSEDYFSKEVYSKDLKTYRVVERNMIAYNPSRINVGSVALQDKCDEVVVSPLYVVFSVDESRVKPGYAVRFLKSKPGLDQIAFQSIGTVRNNLKFKALCQMRLKPPSLAVQEERLANLASIESQINQSRKAIEEFDQLAKSRFVEMFGDPDSNPHGLEVCPLGKVLSVQPSNGMYKPQKDYVSDGSGTPIIRIDSFRSEGPDYSSLKRLNCNESECRRYGINENDIVINRVNSVGCMGKTMLVSHIPEVTVFESNMMRLHSDEAFMIPAFLCAQMTSGFSKSYFEANAKRAIGQASINQKDVKGLPVLVPTIANQKAYLSFVSQVDKSRFVRDHEINFR